MEPEISNLRSLEEPPPFLTSWNRVYAAVILYLIVLMAFLYVVTRYFSY